MGSSLRHKIQVEERLILLVPAFLHFCIDALLSLVIKPPAQAEFEGGIWHWIIWHHIVVASHEGSVKVGVCDIDAGTLDLHI